jgi:hypothetical protein
MVPPWLYAASAGAYHEFRATLANESMVLQFEESENSPVPLNAPRRSPPGYPTH